MKVASILSRPNERNKVIKQLHLLNPGTDLEQIFSSLRQFDDSYQNDAAPAMGSVARAEGRGQDVDKAINENRTVDEKIADSIFAGFAKMEVMWAQKYAKRDFQSASSPSRDAASYTICYCCNDKGYYSRDCPELQNSRCDYCRKDGHLERACKLKKEREPAAGGNREEVSFFHGGRGMVEEAEISMARLVDFGEVCALHSSTKDASKFVCDSGASHHICCDKRLFTSLEPFKGKFKILQVSGELEVTHWGTILVEVDGKYGKETLKLGNVLLLAF